MNGHAATARNLIFYKLTIAEPFAFVCHQKLQGHQFFESRQVF